MNLSVHPNDTAKQICSLSLSLFFFGQRGVYNETYNMRLQEVQPIHTETCKGKYGSEFPNLKTQ